MGLALVGATVEQDAAYWECHVEIPSTDTGGDGSVGACEVMLGVATRKDRKFYDALADQEEGTCVRACVRACVRESGRRKVARRVPKRCHLTRPFHVTASIPTENPDSNGTDLMRKIPVKHGSVIGVAVQQVDLPMVQFLLDGEPLHTLSINRFRGNVHPAVYLPANEGLVAKLVFDEGSFAHMSPAERFGPLIVARGII